MYLKVSSRNLDAATEILADQVASQTQGLEEVHVPPTFGSSKVDASHIHMQAALAKFETTEEENDPSDKKYKSRNKVMVEKSWKVSPDEFIIKVRGHQIHNKIVAKFGCHSCVLSFLNSLSLDAIL